MNGEISAIADKMASKLPTRVVFWFLGLKSP